MNLKLIFIISHHSTESQNLAKIQEKQFYKPESSHFNHRSHSAAIHRRDLNFKLIHISWKMKSNATQPTGCGFNKFSRMMMLNSGADGGAG